MSAGALYGLMALGLALIYKTTDIVNFGHGDMAMISTFVAYALLVQLGWPTMLAFAGALAFAVLLGVLIERVVMRPARDRRATVLGLVVATLGLALILNGVAGLVWGHDVKSFPYAVTGPPLRAGNILVPLDQVLNLAVSLGLAAVLYLFFRYSTLGIAMRATISNRTAALLMGIPVNRVFAVSWGIGVGLGAVAGVLATPALFLEPNRMVDLLIKGFAAAVLGGLTSLPGAVLGGLCLGILENLVGAFISIELKATFAFLLIVLVLAIRPQGLLGQAVRKRV
ncbi:MAG: branched-chain amino acid ABC transporter permease [Armatimonadota bacterium]|nr:branched-chain amino acid ABC transporter permease [Armatimonadota bacterium]